MLCHFFLAPLVISSVFVVGVVIVVDNLITNTAVTPRLTRYDLVVPTRCIRKGDYVFMNHGPRIRLLNLHWPIGVLGTNPHES